MIYFFKFPLHESRGGAEFYTLRHAQELLKQGHKIKLFTSDGKLFRLFEQNKLPRRRLFVGWEPTSKWSLLLWPLTYVIARRKFKKLLINIPEGSTLHMQSLIEKLVLTPLTPVRSIWMEHKIPGRWLKLNPLKFRYLRLAKRVELITVSNFAKQEFIKFGVPEKNIKVEYPTPTSSPPYKGGEREGVFTIGILSRLDAEKGVYDFLKNILPTLKKHTDWQVLIAGEGSGEEKIKKLKTQNQLNLNLLGFVNNLDDFFSQISVLVYPSLVPESYGMAVAEAKARGVPVVATKIGALPEQAPDFLVEQNKPEDWIRYLEAVNNSFN